MRRSAFLASAAAVAAASSPFPVRADATPVRLAYIPTENNAQAFYAQELGLFAKAGLDVRMQPINFSAAIASGVLSGAIDIGNSSSLTLTVAHNKGLPLVFVAPANAFLLHKGNAESGIVVAAASPIRVARDLNGKTFGCSGLGSFGEYIPRAWVDANGGDSSTMKFVEAPNAELGAAVSSGRADAAFISPPAFQKALAEENCRLLAIASDAVAKEFMASGWFATTAWAKANAATVAARESGQDGRHLGEIPQARPGRGALVDAGDVPGRSHARDAPAPDQRRGPLREIPTFCGRRIDLYPAALAAGVTGQRKKTRRVQG
jgi:ABC-type nitrate/sulfonate/bicarbonate transport system substrate-binding protein